MKRHMVAAFLVASVCTSASAADFYKARVAPPPMDPWTGWYVGLNGGYTWSGKSGQIVAFDPASAGNVAAGAHPSFLPVAPRGGLFGGQLGYNRQAGNFVYGIETDFQGVFNKSSVTTFYPGPAFAPTTSTATSEINWLGTTRLRAGFLMAPQFLIYGTGGLAYGETSISTSTTGIAAAYFGQTTQTKVGYAAGGGAEYMFAPRWTFRTEYLFVDLGSTVVRNADTTLNPGQFGDYRFTNTMHTVRGALNYRF